jgi:hypothetical protein
LDEAGVPPPTAETPGPAPAVPLTPEQQSRLDGLPASARDQVLAWIATGDQLLIVEALKILGRPRAAPAALPATTAELLSRVREDPSYPAAAAELLSREFGDRKSWKGFLSVLKSAWEGRIELSSLADAYRQATGPKARNRGAIFMHAIRASPGVPRPT